MNIFNMPFDQFKRKTIIKILLSAVAMIICLVFNIILILFVTEENKPLFTALNILSDIIVFSVLYGYYMVFLNERIKLIRLYSKKQSIGEMITGSALEIKGKERVEKFDCRRITLVNHNTERIVYVIENTLDKYVRIGGMVKFITVNNIAVEAENEG